MFLCIEKLQLQRCELLPRGPLPGGGKSKGQGLSSFFVMTGGRAEAAVGLAILISYLLALRDRNVDNFNLLKVR